MQTHTHNRQLRDQRATRSAVAGVAFQGVYALGQFAVMAILFRRLSQQGFGMWLMIYALAGWMVFAKFGLHFTMYTALGQHALTDRKHAREILTNAGGVVAAIGALLVIVLLTIGWWLPWSDWLNVTETQAVREAGPVAITVLAMAAITMPMMMGGHAMIASQRGDLSQAIAMITQVLMIISLLVGYWLHWPLIALAAVVMSPPLIAGLTQWCVGLGTRILPMPTLDSVDLRLLAKLLTAGVIFMVLDMAMILLLQGGPIILGHVVGPEAVVPYGAAYRLIGLLIAGIMTTCYAYWPAYSEAGQRKDIAWVKAGLTRSWMMMLGMCVVGGAVILLAGRPFIAWWLGKQAVPTQSMLWAAVLFALAFGCYAVISTPLSGLGRLRGQLISAGVMAALSLVLGIGLCHTYGATGLYFGQAIAVAVAAAMNGVYLLRTLHRMTAENASP
jgi:O-antigen/teichoic acid export membrane protein